MEPIDARATIARIRLIGAMTLAFVLGACASHQPAVTLEQSGIQPSGGAGPTPATAAPGSAVPEAVATSGPVPLIAPATVPSTADVIQEGPQDQPLTTQSLRQGSETGDPSDGDDSSGQLSYPAPMEREALKAPDTDTPR